jgi:hypothetical protein
MNIGKILKGIGVIVIICGFISAIPVFGSYKIIALYYIVGGLLSGFTLIGFGELITLAKSIDERLQNKFYESRKKESLSVSEKIDVNKNPIFQLGEDEILSLKNELKDAGYTLEKDEEKEQWVIQKIGNSLKMFARSDILLKERINNLW